MPENEIPFNSIYLVILYQNSTGFKKCCRNDPCNYQTPTPTPTATPVSLKIDTQEEAIQLRMATIKITYYGIPVSNARVDYDGDMIGETDNNDTIEFVLESADIHTITDKVSLLSLH